MHLLYLDLLRISLAFDHLRFSTFADSLIIKWNIKNIWTQFHQRFRRAFFVQKFAQSQNVTRKKAFVQKRRAKNVDEIDYWCTKTRTVYYMQTYKKLLVKWLNWLQVSISPTFNMLLFLHERILRCFFWLTVWHCNFFWQNNIGTKAARKMNDEIDFIPQVENRCLKLASSCHTFFWRIKIKAPFPWMKLGECQIKLQLPSSS